MRTFGRAIIAVICVVAFYVSYLGLSGPSSPDAVHTQALRFMRRGTHYLTPADFTLWHALWLVLFGLLVLLAVVTAIWRRRGS
jgi:hypothetical protein